MVTIQYAAAAAAESLQLYPTLCDPIDGSPPGSHIPGILQARTLEWVTLVLLFAIVRPLQTCLIMPVCVKVRHPPPHLDCCSHARLNPLV